MGLSRDCPTFLSTPIISGLSGLQIWPVHSQRPSQQTPIKNFGEKGAWTYPWTAQSFKVPPPLLSQERVKLRTSNFLRT